MPEAGEFLVPDLGEGLEDVTVLRWRVAVGDSVTLNQPLCDVETEKAEVEIPSPYAGTVVSLGAEEGETVLVGALLARIDLASGVGSPPATPGADAQPAADASAAPGASSQRQPTLVGYGHDESIDKSRRRRGAGMQTPASAAVGATPGPATGAAPAGSGSGGAVSAASGRPLARPPVRLLARRLGVDLAALAPGSGPRGIVTRADVEAAANGSASGVGAAAVPGSASAARSSLPLSATAGAGAAGGVVPGSTIPVTGVRARIADRMTTSRTEIPDATASVTADCTRLLEVRKALNVHAERQGLAANVTPFSLLCRLVVQSLSSNPLLNSTYKAAGPEIVVHDAINLGIGTATERGLVVSVVRDAHRLAVHELSADIARLAESARSGTLAPADMTGSTFTISNFGALGLDEGVPIVNHPEAAILGVGSIRPRPHVVDGELCARPTARLTVAFDHRICDGAEVARFLCGLRDLVEAPELALLLP